MSSVRKTIRSMRILALPLARPKIPPEAVSNPNAIYNPNRMLIYYHFHLIPSSTSGTQENGQSRIKQLMTRASTKAAGVWAGFGKAPEGTWKLKTYEYGERLVDRIDFEELALKSVDPSLGPSIPHPDVTGQKLEDLQEGSNIEKSQDNHISLIYPPSVYTSLTTTAASQLTHPCIIHLRALLTTRIPRHRRGFWAWMIIAPFTAPFMLIPVIPNLPFFFCVWRSWSHYRAYRASQYLSSLLDRNLIVPKPSEELDSLYLAHSSTLRTSPKTPSSTPLPFDSDPPLNSDGSILSSSTPPPADETNAAANSSQRLLLTRKSIPAILELFGLPSTAGADMYRAFEQVRGRIGGNTGR
ncbi:hypothetical protein SERLA73DRAFT_183524 [Serpula lacrymans var. lacrymans S7.3]|uniref:Mitochondrial K+-H+ exchange-related-domain-containing protein n=2 Tax=Serpula lacrymans var. lacrymans TaxID=341189 RepID=F8Q015_SERL3|nr:uncharacterized protein SERLADRAFT_470750 [Serpula lacrymans var. lacrymans S7.9]EGN98487.1 hypothetical protein SERLA73DRAFT_183524 [Serpula lacrymans var. lacrymans S7.3]EGO24064.1 hypothetical protein SERLADRAFT_470750 [Serpula lacrymans var. lacrymans S7.9]